MPIVRKVSDLEVFVAKLMDKGFDEIGNETLRYEIAAEFGISDYVIKNIGKRLKEFNLIKDLGYGRWKLVNPAITKNDAEKEAEDELKRLGIK